MIAVNYPAALPCPMPGSFQPRMRRVASSIDGPLQQRARQRDAAGLASQYTYIYTPAQMQVWRDWHRDTLLEGRRWFAHALPGRTGLAQRVVRYRSVQQQLLGIGLYRVSASFEQRGRSVAPQLPPPLDVQIDLNCRTNAGLDSSAGIVLSGADPGANYLVSVEQRVYTAWSRWDSDGSPSAGGLPWECSYEVTHAGGSAGFLPTRYTSAAAAFAAATDVILSGYDQYTFWLYDNDLDDNRGGLSLRVQTVS